MLYQIFCKLWLAVLSVSGSGAFPRPLSQAKEREYLAAMKNGDEKAKNILIEHNLRLVAHIVKKYYNATGDTDDLISIGTIGLIKGITTFNPDKGARLSSYASRCVENEILMYFRQSKKSQQDISINEPIDVDKDGRAITLIDIIAVDDTIADDLHLKINSEKLKNSLRSTLNDRELSIICLRYGLNGHNPLTQREVAGMLNISRSYVSRIEKKALEKLRAQFD
ncbi:MAG: RNA polymerase sporulation sigma factor SigK [Clostridia bacterium]|nr:RNA polymerase sporulation sigma factor SigK [Clostridia bacterium]